MQQKASLYSTLVNLSTGGTRIIQSHSLARLCFELSGIQLKVYLKHEIIVTWQTTMKKEI